MNIMAVVDSQRNGMGLNISFKLVHLAGVGSILRLARHDARRGCEAGCLQRDHQQKIGYEKLKGTANTTEFGSKRR